MIKFKKNNFLKEVLMKPFFYIILSAITLPLIWSLFSTHKVNYFACKSSPKRLSYDLFFAWDELAFWSSWSINKEEFLNTNFIWEISSKEIIAGPGHNAWEKQKIIVDRMNGIVEYKWTDREGKSRSTVYKPCKKINKSNLPEKAKPVL